MKLTLFSIIGLFTISCSYKKIDHPAPYENTVVKKEKFRITLPENHETGYMWQLSNKYDSHKLDYYGSVFHGNEKGVYFNFEAIDNGKTTLTFALIKYQDTTEVKHFIINVE